MTRGHRAISMVAGTIALLSLGFVVAVAAESPPANSGARVIEIVARRDIDLTRVLAWVLLVSAVLGVVVLAFGLGQTRSPVRRGGRHGLLGLMLGLLLFVVILRFMRPLTQSLLGQARDVADGAAEAPVSTGTGSGGVWLFAVLVAAIVATALTRVGLAVRSGPPAQPMGSGPEPAVSARPESSRHTRIPVAGDPRSRIIGAYSRFEEGAGAVGVVRSPSETASRHARRACKRLGLDTSDVGLLSRHHAAARFGLSEPSPAAAREAETISKRLTSEMTR